jgi:hypothetical protein
MHRLGLTPGQLPQDRQRPVAHRDLHAVPLRDPRHGLRDRPIHEVVERAGGELWNTITIVSMRATNSGQLLRF